MAVFDISIIIPVYNTKDLVEKCVIPILELADDTIEVICVNDGSRDNSLEVLKNIQLNYPKMVIVDKDNGGLSSARNSGLEVANGEYILFLDSDDWFSDENVFQKIYNKIIENNYPDCVSLSYDCLIGKNKSLQIMDRNNQKELVESLYVACWTKCVKRELVPLFPENTLMEDVVQHIKCCDKLKTIVSIKEPMIVWNRNNMNSCSREENQNLQQGKWQSSMYRYAADLMDFSCENQVCEDHRKWRLDICLNNIKDGKYIQ